MIDPTPEQIAQLVALPDDRPVVMINLLSFREPDGVASYGRYGAAVQPHLDAVGGRVLFSGDQRLTVVGEEERPWWDAIIVVEYPSIAAFMKMVMNPDYQAITHHRTEGLDRAELIATGPWIPAPPA